MVEMKREKRLTKKQRSCKMWADIAQDCSFKMRSLAMFGSPRYTDPEMDRISAVRDHALYMAGRHGARGRVCTKGT